MNTTFKFNHLVLILKRYFIENKSRELTYWGMMILVFTFVHSSGSTKIILYIMGFIFASKQFKSFAFTPGGMHYLLIPATHLEKLISAIFLTTIYYFTMFTITYSIGNILGTTLFNLVFTQSTPVVWDFLSATGSHSFGNDINFSMGNSFLEMIINFLILQSVFMLGSIYFKHNAIGRTMLSIFAIYFVFGMIELFLFKVIFVDISVLRGMSSFNLMAGNSILQTNLMNGLKVFSYILIPLFWTVTYFRLTEKQV